MFGSKQPVNFVAAFSLQKFLKIIAYSCMAHKTAFLVVHVVLLPTSAHFVPTFTVTPTFINYWSMYVNWRKANLDQFFFFFYYSSLVGFLDMDMSFLKTVLACSTGDTHYKIEKSLGPPKWICDNFNKKNVLSNVLRHFRATAKNTTSLLGEWVTKFY